MVVSEQLLAYRSQVGKRYTEGETHVVEELVVQIAGETRFVVDCSMNPAALVGQVKITFVPEGIIASCGVLTDPNERLNTVPDPKLPPATVVPYRVVPNKINPFGPAPSLFMGGEPERALKL